MRLWMVAVWTGAGLALVGCSFTQPAAPIREAGAAKRPARSAPVRPDRYQVQPGDSLFRIAFDLGLDYRQLALWNGLGDPFRIRVGDVLRVQPPPEILAARSIPASTGQAPAAAPSQAENEPAEEAPVSWVWPAKGVLVTRFAGVAGGKGLDIAGPRGSPVTAAAAGKIVYVGAGLRGYGKLIIIKHDKALLSAYGHNERVLVIEGQTVKQGQPIAEMGDTDAERVKLHFEIREYGKPVDPLIYLPTT